MEANAKPATSAAAPAAKQPEPAPVEAKPVEVEPLPSDRELEESFRNGIISLITITKRLKKKEEAKVVGKLQGALELFHMS